MSRLDEVRERLRRPPAWGPNEQGHYMVDMTVEAYERDLDLMVEAAREDAEVGNKEITDHEGTRWVYDGAANTYQPISPDGDASVPMPAIVFSHVYPELYLAFWPELAEMVKRP